ncbi:MAG TPA: LppA family lipoprotein [Mycobacterium sp.]|nr:LppA family lipoprotein [Mycobacterium sp.]
MSRPSLVIALVVATSASACHYDPHPWPKPGEASANTLERMLNQRDSLQDAANDLVAVTAAMRDAVQQAYPAATWTATSNGDQAGCPPPFVFLSGKIYQLPNWQSPAPASPAGAHAVVKAATEVLEAHGVSKVDVHTGRSVSGALPRDHGVLGFAIEASLGSNRPDMVVSGATGCHHVASGPGPWNTSAMPTS